MRKRDPKIIRVIAALLAVVMFIAQIGESVPAFYVHAEGEAEYSIEHKVNSSCVFCKPLLTKVAKRF